MNISVKRTFDEKKSDEPRAKLKKVFGKILENFCHLEKKVEVSKEILAECSNKIDDLRSQIVELESIMEEISASDQHQSLDARVQERNRLRKISDQEIIEEITIDGCYKSERSNRASVTKNLEDTRKKQRTNSEDEEISFINQQKIDNSTPGSSKETTKIWKSNRLHSHNEQAMNDKEIKEISEAVSAEDIVQIALEKTKGVLSSQELHTFLYLSDNVEDPVQLAKVSFTKDIKMLYFQLMTFHFQLKVANDTAEVLHGPSCTNRDLEKKVKYLVHTLQGEVLHHSFK